MTPDLTDEKILGRTAANNIKDQKLKKGGDTTHGA